MLNRAFIVLPFLSFVVGCTVDASSSSEDSQLGSLKPDIAGLVDRGGVPHQPVGGSSFAVPPSSWQGVVNGFVVNATWADLQPTRGGPIASNNVIDQAIAATPAGQHFKLRIWAGEYAPQWAKSLSGGALPTGSGMGVGHWWLAPYETAYADLQTKLAAKYDAAPQLRNVTIAGCMTLYAEPLLKDDVDPSVLINAGYTNAADQQCQEKAIQAHGVWKTTRQSFSFNPYLNINPQSPHTDEAFTESLMDYCATTLGKRCALENNSIRYPNNPGDYAAMYSHMAADQQKYGVTIDFQTATLTKLNTAPEQGLGAALDWACGGYSAGIHASSVELPSGYMTDGKLGSPGAYQSYDTCLLADPH